MQLGAPWEHVGNTPMATPASLAFLTAQSFVQSRDHTVFTPGRGPGSLFLLMPHAELSFNTFIRFLIQQPVSNFRNGENSRDAHSVLAQHLAFFSLRNPEARVEYILVVGRTSRFLLGAKSHCCMHAFIQFNLSMDGPLAKALIRVTQSK